MIVFGQMNSQNKYKKTKERGETMSGWAIEHLVVCECGCPWEVFVENVRGQGYSMRRLRERLAACETRDDALEVINEFI